MKRESESRAGFTIIEVIFFLAISSMMIIAAMIAVRGRTASVQFTDAVRSTESFFDRRQTQILAGSITGESQECRWNSGPNYSAGASDGSCIFLGYMYHFDPSQPSEIDVYQMYGGRLMSTDQCFVDNPDDPLFCVSPTPTPVVGSPSPVETFQIPWGVEVFRTWAGANGSQLFGYLRNPNGQNLIPISFDAGLGVADLDNQPLYRRANSTTRIGDEFSSVVCLESATGKRASITHGRDEDQFAVIADFDFGSTPIYCS